MTKKKINMSSSGLTRRSRNKDIHSTGFPVKRGMTKDLESGRSMVEMLGVLAIVGVLSVGSIAGYTYAMNKYYANELLAGASERAVLVAAQLVAGKTPSLSEFAGHTAPGGTFGDVEEFEDGGFGLKVSKVKEAVCQNILKAVDGTEVFIAKNDNAEVLNEMSESDCSGDDNSFLFVYADDMGAIDSIFDPETPTDEEKKEYICTGASAGVYQVLVNNDTTSYRFITSCSECSFAGMYDSDEAAVAAMCEYGSSAFYRCSNSAIYKGNDYYGGEFVSSCNGACTNGYAEYASDEAAIAAMCVLLDEYTCNGKNVMKNGMPVTECAASCTNAGMYDTTDDAIAMMCHSKWRYTCNGKNVMKNGMRVTECGVSCTNAGMYDSDSEAMPAMCNSLFMYTCNGKTIMKNGMPVTECAASCTNASRYYSDEAAIAAMCTPMVGSLGTYYCSGNVLLGPDFSFLCPEGCYDYGYFENGNEAIAELCTPIKEYFCSAAGVYRASSDNHKFIASCSLCSNMGTYVSDEVAIAEMCGGPKTYICTGSNGVYKYFGNEYKLVTHCDPNLCSYASTYYSDEEAIAAMCIDPNACSSEACVTEGLYYCDENNLLGQKGNFHSWCECKAGISRFEGQSYDSVMEAIENMCKNYSVSGNE